MPPRIRPLAFLALLLAAAPVTAQDEEAYVSLSDGPADQVFRSPEHATPDEHDRTVPAQVELPFFLQRDQCVSTGSQTTARVYYASTRQVYPVAPSDRHCRLPPVDDEGFLERWITATLDLFKKEERRQSLSLSPYRRLGGLFDRLNRAYGNTVREEERRPDSSDIEPDLALLLGRLSVSPPDSVVGFLAPRHTPLAATARARPTFVIIGSAVPATYRLRVLGHAPRGGNNADATATARVDTIFQAEGMHILTLPSELASGTYTVVLTTAADSLLDAARLEVAEQDRRELATLDVRHIMLSARRQAALDSTEVWEPAAAVSSAEQLVRSGYDLDAVATVANALTKHPSDPGLRSAFHTFMWLYQPERPRR